MGRKVLGWQKGQDGFVAGPPPGHQTLVPASLDDKQNCPQDFKKFLNRVLEVHYKDHEDGLPVVPPQVPEKADRLSGAIENMDEL